MTNAGIATNTVIGKDLCYVKHGDCGGEGLVKRRINYEIIHLVE
jgi:hypothetical protein